MIYVIYDTATGAVKSFASLKPDGGLPPGLSVYSLDVPYSAMSEYAWSAQARTLGLAPAPVSTVMSRLAFTSRLTLAEQVVIEMAKETADPQTRATLRVLDANLMRAGDVDVTDPRTQMGAEVLVDVLTAAGMVAGTAEARAEWLAAVLAPVALT